MTNSMYGLLFTFLVGIFFLFVLFLSKYLKNKKNFLVFLLGLTFSVMIGMGVFGLLDEIIECFSNVKYSYLIIFVFTLIGFLLTLFIDKLVPDHHDSESKIDKDKYSEEYMKRYNDLLHPDINGEYFKKNTQDIIEIQKMTKEVNQAIEDNPVGIVNLLIELLKEE